MGFRFRKSFKIAPGVKLNVSKKGISSVSLGGKGMTVNVGKKGVRKTVSLKGTGLSHSTYQSYNKGKKSTINTLNQTNNRPQTLAEQISDNAQNDQMARLEAMRERARQVSEEDQPLAIRILKKLGIVVIAFIVFWGGFFLLVHFMATSGSNTSSSQTSIHGGTPEHPSPQAQRTEAYKEKFGDK